MRLAAITCLALLTLACTTQGPEQADAKATPKADADADAKGVTPAEPAPEEPEWKPTRRKTEVVRKDLLAEDLPPLPTLDAVTVTTLSEGTLSFPEGTDELAPRAAVALGGGLLLAGQAYLARHPSRPSRSWRWLGFAPAGDDQDGALSSVKYEPGAIRAAIADGQGGALLTGTGGVGFDARGWFGVVDGEAKLGVQADLDSPNSTEMFDLLPGTREGELALVAGYVDAQGWVVSLDDRGQQRWQKFIGSYGYTQVRAFARLGQSEGGAPGDLLAIGSRAKTFGESWWARVPGDGGDGAGPDDVEQDLVTIEGADQHQMLHAIVDLGDAGFIALGAAKKNHIQDHDQLVAVGFDMLGTLTWSKVLADVRVTEVLGGQARDGVASFIIEIPNAQAAYALAQVELPAAADQPARVRALAGTEGWTSAGFIEGGEASVILGHAPTQTGIKWRQLSLTE